MTLTALQRRVLTALAIGDLVWEVAGSGHFTQFHEKTGREVRIRIGDLETLRKSGWVRRVWHDAASQKLDYWELTPDGWDLIESLLKSGAIKEPIPLIRALSA